MQPCACAHSEKRNQVWFVHSLTVPGTQQAVMEVCPLTDVMSVTGGVGPHTRARVHTHANPWIPSKSKMLSIITGPPPPCWACVVFRISRSSSLQSFIEFDQFGTFYLEFWTRYLPQIEDFRVKLKYGVAMTSCTVTHGPLKFRRLDVENDQTQSSRLAF